MTHALSIRRIHLSPIRRFAMTQRYSALLAALFASLMLSLSLIHI